MRRLLLAAAAATLLATPASAGDDSTHDGHCRLTDVAAGAQLVRAEVTVYSRHAEDNPVGATVTCDVYVNGTHVESATGFGYGVVVVAKPVTLTIAPTDSYAVCTTVDYTDATPTSSGCAYLPVIDYPDEIVWTFVEEHVDPVVCPALSALFPPDGDVPDVWDCPPYGS